MRRLGLKVPAAGKTGTTNGTKDAWFAGYTPNLLAVVWVGFDEPKSTKLTGSSGAAPIWAEFMKCATPMLPKLDFIAPKGVVFRRLDRESGLIATRFCPESEVVNEVFVEGTEPVTPCPIHGREYQPRDTPSGLPRPGATPPPPKKKSLWDQLFG